jgi:hypothetical protein
LVQLRGILATSQPTGASRLPNKPTNPPSQEGKEIKMSIKLKLKTTREINNASEKDLNDWIGKLTNIIYSDCSRNDRAMARGYRAIMIRQLGVRREENARS